MTMPARTRAQLRDHYEIEKELAGRLRNASWAERRGLYPRLYDELFQRVPRHPQLMREASDEQREHAVAQQMTLLRHYLQKGATFLEIGPGDCSLSLEITRHVKRVYAVDVATEIHKGLIAPANFRLFLSDGRDVPVPRSSVDLAYSNQLMEHLHPDDALTQLRGIHEALAPNGKYICVTPNRLTGPHDVSRGFDKVATGFHLKEYTIAELRRLFKDVGFSDISLIVTVKGRHFRHLSIVARAVETFHSVTSLPVLTPGLLRIKVVGTK